VPCRIAYRLHVSLQDFAFGHKAVLDKDQVCGVKHLIAFVQNCWATEGSAADSLMVTSPSGLCSILSMPFGPKEDLRVRATVLAARMLAFTASVPRRRDLLPCSYIHRQERNGHMGPEVHQSAQPRKAPAAGAQQQSRSRRKQAATGPKRTRMMMNGLPYSSNAKDILYICPCAGYEQLSLSKGQE